jgi:hypothetical protein
MMFHKQYYSLEEAAQKLAVDVESILYDALKLKCFPSLKIQNYDVIVRQNECSSLIDVRNPENMHEENIELAKAIYKRLESLILSCETISMIYHQGYARLANSDELRLSNEAIIDFEGKAEFFSAVPAERLYIYSPSRKNKLTSKDLVIHHAELTRLLALKAEHDGKPTAEQLQQQLDEANARIAELEAQLSQQDKEESVKGFNTSLAIIHALYDMADSPPIKTVAAKTEEIGRIIKEDAIRNRLNNTTFKE